MRAALLLPVLLALIGCQRDPFTRAPRLILFAPDRPEDFRFLDDQAAGVALLLGRVDMSSSAARLEPRRAPFYLPPGQPYLIAVFDVESSQEPVAPSVMQTAAELIAKRADEHFLRAVQLRFGPAPGNRTVPGDLLARLRPLLRPHQLLSVALPVAACADRELVDALLADAIVPVLDGSLRPSVATRCGGSAWLRLGADLVLPAGMAGGLAHVYVEAPDAWTPERVEAARQSVLHP